MTTEQLIAEYKIEILKTNAESEKFAKKEACRFDRALASSRLQSQAVRASIPKRVTLTQMFARNTGAAIGFFCAVLPGIYLAFLAVYWTVVAWWHIIFQ